MRGAGGAPIGAYRDPLGGRPLVLASLPLSAVQPTPFQRDLSPTHAKRLALKIDETAAFLDPLDRGARRGRAFVDAERPSSPGRRQGARPEANHGVDLAGREAGLSHPRAQHREGAQPARSQPRGDSHGAQPGEAAGILEGVAIHRGVRIRRTADPGHRVRESLRASRAAPTAPS